MTNPQTINTYYALNVLVYSITNGTYLIGFSVMFKLCRCFLNTLTNLSLAILNCWDIPANLFFSPSDVTIPPAVYSLLYMNEITPISMVFRVHVGVQLSGWKLVYDKQIFSPTLNRPLGVRK